MFAHLPPLARLGKRHRDCVFVYIQADVDDTMLHDPSPMHEARRRYIQRNPRNPAYCETGRPYLRRTSGLEREIALEETRAGIADPQHFAYPTYAKAAML